LVENAESVGAGLDTQRNVWTARHSPLIVDHLGNGASITAAKRRKSIDTSKSAKGLRIFFRAVVASTRADAPNVPIERPHRLPPLRRMAARRPRGRNLLPDGPLSAARPKRPRLNQFN
jgi:Acetokinase family